MRSTAISMGGNRMDFLNTLVSFGLGWLKPTNQ